MSNAERIDVGCKLTSIDPIDTRAIVRNKPEMPRHLQRARHARAGSLNLWFARVLNLSLVALQQAPSLECFMFEEQNRLTPKSKACFQF